MKLGENGRCRLRNYTCRPFPLRYRRYIWKKKKQLNIFRTKDEIFNFSKFQIKLSNFVSFVE